MFPDNYQGEITKMRLVTIILCLTLAIGAHARADTPPNAEQLSQQGMEAARSGNMERAVELWQQALAGLSGEALLAVHFNLGLAYARLGDQPAACNHLNLYISGAGSPEPQAVSLVKKLEKAIKPTHGRVTVVVVPSDATVTFAGPDANLALQAPVTWWLAPGEHHVRATAAGFKDASLELDIAPGSDARFKLRLDAAAKAADPIAPPPQSTPSKGSAVGQWILIGAGAATVIAAGALHGMAHARNDELWQETYPDVPDDITQSQQQEALYQDAYDSDVKPLATAAYVLYGVGAAAAAGGVLWMVLDKSSDGAESSTSLSPMLSPGSVGTTFTLTF